MHGAYCFDGRASLSDRARREDVPHKYAYQFTAARIHFAVAVRVRVDTILGSGPPDITHSSSMMRGTSMANHECDC